MNSCNSFSLKLQVLGDVVATALLGAGLIASDLDEPPTLMIGLAGASLVITGSRIIKNYIDYFSFYKRAASTVANVAYVASLCYAMGRATRPGEEERSVYLDLLGGVVLNAICLPSIALGSNLFQGAVLAFSDMEEPFTHSIQAMVFREPPLIEATNGISGLAIINRISARILLARGANPNSSGTKGEHRLPLRLAVGNSNAAMVKLLLKHGAKIDGLSQDILLKIVDDLEDDRDSSFFRERKQDCILKLRHLVAYGGGPWLKQNSGNMMNSLWLVQHPLRDRDISAEILTSGYQPNKRLCRDPHFQIYYVDFLLRYCHFEKLLFIDEFSELTDELHLVNMLYQFYSDPLQQLSVMENLMSQANG